MSRSSAEKALTFAAICSLYVLMHDAPPNPGNEPDEAIAARAARRRQAVDRMVQMGVMLTERLCAEVDAAAVGDEAADAGVAARLDGRLGVRESALAYTRLFRAVRLGAALGERLDNPDWEPQPAARGRGGRAGAAADEASAGGEPDYDEIVRRRDGMRGVILTGTIMRVVESLIETEVEGDIDGIGGERGTRLLEAFHERLEDDEELEAIGGRSIGESIALICQDLGLSPDWDDWRYEEWAKLEAREEILGSPFGRPRRAVRARPEPEPADGEARAHDPP